jgi:hypothetical protein
MAAAFEGHILPGSTFSVVWTRGKGCAELAELLDRGSPTRVQGDLRTECIEARADLLVSRRLPPSFDFVSMAVPSDFVPGTVGSIGSDPRWCPRTRVPRIFRQRSGS